MALDKMNLKEVRVLLRLVAEWVRDYPALSGHQECDTKIDVHAL